MISNRRTFCLFLILIVVVVSRSPLVQSAPNKVLKVGVVAMNTSLRPENAYHYLHLVLLPLHAQNLVRVDKSAVVRAELLRKWNISKDQRTYTFYLRDDVTFHDGSPLKSDHVLDSFKRIIKELDGVYTIDLFKELIQGGELTTQNKMPTGFKKIDDHTFQIVLNKPFSFFLDFIATNRFGVYKRVSNQGYPIGSGPYEPFVDHKNKMIRFKKYKGFKDQKLKWDEIEVHLIRNQSHLKELVSKNKIDVFLGTSIENMMTDVFSESYQYFRYPRFGFFHMFYNLDRKVFQNDALRKALTELVRYGVQQVKKPGLFLEHQPTFVSPGILYRSYYASQRPTLSPKEFKQKFPELNFESPLQIYFRKDYVNESVVDSVANALKAAHVPAAVHRQSYQRVADVIENKSYDMALYGQYGFDSDPEAFLIAIIRDFRNNDYVKSKGLLKNELKDFKYMPVSKDRLKKYSDFFESFENEELMLPLFRLYYPIVHRKGLTIPYKGFNLDLKLYEIE